METRTPRPPGSSGPKKKTPELNFSPITEGLGFHPFSDGLPYAPIARTTKSPNPLPPNRSMGTGAMSAGPATIARVSVPIAAPLSAGHSHSPSAPQQHSPYAPTAQKMPAPGLPSHSRSPQSLLQTPIHGISESRSASAESLVTIDLGVDETPGFAYLAKRVVAYLLDTLLNVALCAGALAAALWNQDLNPDSLVNPGVALLFALFLVAFNWALITAQEIAFGTSAGKRLFGLSLHGSPAAIFLRAFFFLPSVGFCGLGLVWALFDSKRRCWHDVAVDLQPVETARL